MSYLATSIPELATSIRELAVSIPGFIVSIADVAPKFAELTGSAPEPARQPYIRGGDAVSSVTEDSRRFQITGIPFRSPLTTPLLRGLLTSSLMQLGQSSWNHRVQVAQKVHSQQQM